jgi:hypothetical protein
MTKGQYNSTPYKYIDTSASEDPADSIFGEHQISTHPNQLSRPNFVKSFQRIHAI